MTNLTRTIRQLGEDYCLWETDDRVFNLGVVGTGPGFMSILDLIYTEKYREFLPDIALVAIAEPGLGKSKLKLIHKMGVPVYDTYEQMLEKHPELDMLIELVGKRFQIKKLQSKLSDRVSLIDHTAAVFLCGLRDMARVNTYCQVNLDRQKVLLRAIIDEIKEDILLLDLHSKVVDMNRNVWSRAGLDKEQLIGKPCWEVEYLDYVSKICPDGQDRDCPIHNTLATKTKGEALITRINNDGQLKYFRVYSYPIFNTRGVMTHVMIMRRDITERTLREKHQQQTDKLAIVGEMSTYLAHEIRNPLFAIGGFTNSLLRSKNIDDSERDKLQIIAEETKRLDKMLSGILNFVKPAHTEAEHVDIGALAKETVELMSIGYSKSGIGFKLNIPDELPKVKGQEELFKQCLINLLKNSMEAMEEGGRITITAYMDTEYVYLDVADTGSGMSEKDMEKVFSPFYTTKEKGCGLGLAMIKKIVEEFGGRIRIKSKEDEGTVVTIMFSPVLAGEEASPLNGSE